MLGKITLPSIGEQRAAALARAQERLAAVGRMAGQGETRDRLEDRVHVLAGAIEAADRVTRAREALRS